MDSKGDPKSFAQAVDAQLGLSAFVDWWNDGDVSHSVIATYTDLEDALALTDTRWDPYMDAVVDAKKHGINLRRELSRTLGPHIRSTADRAVRCAVETWAKAVAGCGPLALGCEEELRTKTAWINWCLHYVRRPIVTSPEGVRQMSERNLRPLLRSALAGRVEFAIASGWIGARGRSQNITCFRSKAPRYLFPTPIEIHRIAMTPLNLGPPPDKAK